MLLKEEDLNKILKYIKDYLGENIEEDILKINDDLSLKISKTFRKKIPFQTLRVNYCLWLTRHSPCYSTKSIISSSSSHHRGNCVFLQVSA